MERAWRELSIIGIAVGGPISKLNENTNIVPFYLHPKMGTPTKTISHAKKMFS